MSDPIKHECGIALVRLLKPLSYYQEKYGTALYGINKMYLLMEKQHNRGQDGAGLANIKFDVQPGKRYISRTRSNDQQPIQEVFAHVNSYINDAIKQHPDKVNDAQWLKDNLPFVGELYLGHVRYGTYGGNSIEAVHPFLRQNNWMHRNLIVAGNFNLTNVDDLFNTLVEIGQHPKEKADTITVMEKIGHFLDEEVEDLYYKFKSQGVSKREASPLIARDLDVQRILQRATRGFDGGYAMAGLIGHGDAFVLRDPAGIRPAFYYKDDEVVVVASERPVIQTAFKVAEDKVKEIEPGEALVIKKNGEVSMKPVLNKLPKKACSFERIYFSRGSDKDIYRERKEMGRLLVPSVLESVENDIKNTVFSYIPNTAETSFLGMVEGVMAHLNEDKKKRILELGANITQEELHNIISERARIEKIAIKDAKLRTFITEDASRDDLVAHVYDITYGGIRKDDNLVIIDDSIVRGTTLKKSIIKMVDRLDPKRIVVVSSAPQIRYPDCYGIDMARLGDFIAFRAAVALLEEHHLTHVLDEVYQKCKQQENQRDEDIVNYVKEVYKPFTYEQISDKIAELITAFDVNAEVKVIYQKVDDLHQACPDHKGDWYFTGDYPTPGGMRVVNKAFINFMEGKSERAY